MDNNKTQVAGAVPAGAVGARLATEVAPAVEILEFGVGYKLYRERLSKDHIRLVHMKIDTRDQANYSMRVLELSDDNVLRIYKKWSYPWDWGTRILIETRLEPKSAEKVRHYFNRVRSYKDYDDVAYWLLTARYVMTREGAIIDNKLREPKI